MAKTGKENAKQQDLTTFVNIDELKTLLYYVIKNNMFLQEQNKPSITIEVEGESGFGKTSTVLQVAEEMGLPCVKLNLTQIEELGDLVGSPIRQFQLRKRESSEEPKWIDENLLEDYIKRLGYEGTGKNRMSYCPPEWIADQVEGGILLIDDWNRADMRFIQALMELIDRQQYISWKLPKNWHILLTSNPDNGEYIVNSTDSAQKTRYIKSKLKFDISCWGRWAELNQIDSRCINFFLANSEIVDNGNINARSVTTFFNALSSIKDFQKELPLIQMIGDGSIGPDATHLFTMFINNRLDKLISPHDILFKKIEEVTAALKEAIGLVSSKDYRADIASIISTRIINYTSIYAKSNKIDDNFITRLSNLISSNIFNSDICYNLVKSIYSNDRTKFIKITLDKNLIKYALT